MTLTMSLYDLQQVGVQALCSTCETIPAFALWIAHGCRIKPLHMCRVVLFGKVTGSLHSRLLMLLLPVLALYALLLVGGVELNPGPSFVCKTCNHSFQFISQFCSHVNIHSSDKNVRLYCPFEQCTSHFSTLRSLETHLSRDHKGQKQVSAPPCEFQCPIVSCGRMIPDRKAYLQHMPLHISEGFSFTCGYPNCSTHISTLPSFRSHVSQNHPSTLPPSIDVIMASTSANSSAALCSHGLQNISTGVSPPIEENVGMASGSSEVLSVGSYGLQNHPPVQPTSAVLSENEQEGPSKNAAGISEAEAKDQLGKFYLKLEGVHFLPTKTVQVIAEEITLVTEMSHYFLKKSMRFQLAKFGLDEKAVEELVANTFLHDPVYNIHHKDEDAENLSTDHLRKVFWKNNYPFLTPIACPLGLDENGRKKVAHKISIRESLSIMLKDPKVKEEVLNSFDKTRQSHDVFTDFTDGSAFNKHLQNHNGGKCIQILIFSDSFDSSAFGPSVGLYKAMGFYFVIGNISPQYRSKVDLIQMFYMILEKHMKASEKEELDDVDKLKKVLKPVLDEFENLSSNGIEFDGEIIPVCILFQQGDNLGQHIIGGFVGSFSSQYPCRFCPITQEKFRTSPWALEPLRTPNEYDRCVAKAKSAWKSLREKTLLHVERVKARRHANNEAQGIVGRIRAPGSRTLVKRLLSKSALKKLQGVHYKGVKYRPSPLNSKKTKFHVCTPALPPCLAHDLFEGIAKKIIPQILKYLIEDKKWFDFETLNRRIKSFPAAGSDMSDAPTCLKSLDSLGGNACENWNLIRLLPFMIGDLIQDVQDDMWQLYLQFKVIVEYACAPKISVKQVLDFKSLIQEYLMEVKKLLPNCLIPKQHILMHYPDLITIFGPLIRLFTLRFESKHVFFKNVAKSCRNFKNFTFTLTRKYVCRFAYDNSSGRLLPEDVSYNSSHSSYVTLGSILENKRANIPDDFFQEDLRSLTSVSVKGVEYKVGYYMVLDNVESCDLKVGRIDMIFINTSSGLVSFLCDERLATNTFHGFFAVQVPSHAFSLRYIDQLPDYYPLPSYTVGGQECISLKHSMVKG